MLLIASKATVIVRKGKWVMYGISVPVVEERPSSLLKWMET